MHSLQGRNSGTVKTSRKDTLRRGRIDVAKTIMGLVGGLQKGDFISVIDTINDPPRVEKGEHRGGKGFQSDTQGKTALYKLMQTVRGFSEECENNDDSKSCSKAVAKIYANISAVASRQSRSDVLKVIKGVFEGYVLGEDKGAKNLKERLDHFLVFLELIVANVR